MGGFFLFLLILVLVIFFIALGLVGSILSGILRFLGIGSRKHNRFSNQNYSEEPTKPHQSTEGAKRMRKFKKAAEDTDFEIVE